MQICNSLGHVWPPQHWQLVIIELSSAALLSSIITKASRNLCRVSQYGLPSVALSCGGQWKTRLDGREI